MNLKYLIVGIIILIFLSGCTKTPEEITDSRIQDLTEENGKLQNEVTSFKSQLTDLNNQLDIVKKERDDYLKELDDFYLTQITGDVDLIYWNDDDMITALGAYNDKFKTASWKTYIYRRDTKDFHWSVGGSFFDDPFFELRRKDQDQELDPFHFRIDRLAINNNRSLAQKSYELYLQGVLKESQKDPELTCFEQTTCRDIKVLKCVSGSKNYHSWFEGSHLFTSRFDSREALDAFEKLYCRPDPYAG